MDVDFELTTLATSQLAICVCLPQQQQQEGVPGFPEFPSCWDGEEPERHGKPNLKIDVVDDDDDEEEARERELLLAEAHALKQAAQNLKYRRPMRREAVNRYGMRKGNDKSSSYNKPKVHKKGSGRKQTIGRHDMEGLRKSLKSMRVNVKCKLE